MDNNPVLGEGGLHHASIRTRDWDGTLRFYRDVLGFTLKMSWLESTGEVSDRLADASPRNQRWAYLDAGDGTYLEIFDDPGFMPSDADADPVSGSGGALVHLSLRTSRIDHVCAHARAHGVTVIGEPVDFTLPTSTGQGDVVVRVCFIRGPNHEWIELLQNAP
jgi:glyoxylase I family protein